jgi:hypothetical protein
VKGIVLCEFSGTVSGALRARGLECWSCDILPTEGDPAFHLQEDAREVAYYGGWDFAVMHPDCTYLSNSGSKHLYIDCDKEKGIEPFRWARMENGALFYRTLRDAPIEFKAVENPVMHEHGIKATRRSETHFYHPHHFGDPFFKLTGFETVGFPPLKRTHWMNVPKPGTPEHNKWSKVHRMAPGKNRDLERARFEPGFARAIAAQWGAFLLGEYDL